MKKSVPCAAVLVLALCGAFPAMAQQSPTAVVLTVNEEPVYAWEIGLLVPQIQQEMARQGMKPEQNTVIQAAMQRVVDAKLLAQEAKRQKMQPNDQRVKETMAQIEGQAGGREAVDHTSHQGRFRADDGQVDSLLLSKAEQAIDIIDGQRHVRHIWLKCCTGIAGCYENGFNPCRLCNTPCQRMLASTTSYDQYFHLFAQTLSYSHGSLHG